MWDIFTPTVLVTLAGAFYVLGFLIINQVILRILILLGSAAYILYYATVAAEPLWGAIYTTLLITAANVIGFIGLFARNAGFSVPAAHRDIYERFHPIAPGDFRALMRLAQRYVLPQDTEVTTEGAPVNTLYFFVSGTATAAKGNVAFPMPQSVFVGEVAYLLGQGSAATTHLHAGAEVLAWDIATLRARMARKPRLKLALDAVISQDLARKVSLAVAPAQALERAQAAFSSAHAPSTTATRPVP